MAIIQCPNGHYFDDNKYVNCPICAGISGPTTIEEEKTMGLDEIINSNERTQQLTPEGPEQIFGDWDNEKTVSLEELETGESPLLVGWLVCTEGESRGQDYRLYPGFNRIGRGLDSDICIQDPHVAQKNHCSVVYDKRSGKFYLIPGQGSNTYLNGTDIQKPVELMENVPFSIGKHTLELSAFCRKGYRWQK